MSESNKSITFMIGDDGHIMQSDKDGEFEYSDYEMLIELIQRLSVRNIYLEQKLKDQ